VFLIFAVKNLAVYGKGSTRDGALAGAGKAPCCQVAGSAAGEIEGEGMRLGNPSGGAA